MVMNNNHVDILVDDENWAKVTVISEARCAEVLNMVCDYLRKNQTSAKYDLQKNNRPIDITLNLSNAQTIQQLNAQFRNLDKPTNVLSFANIDSDDFELVSQQDERVFLGDIIMAWEVLFDEATQKQIPLEHHFMHLLVHGILHLLGFDHQTDDEAEVMESIEIVVLKQLNIDNPYI